MKYGMYQEIQKLKRMGFTKSKIAEKLSLDRGTVGKYFIMNSEDYRKYLRQLQDRVKLFDKYKQLILEIFQANGNRSLNTAAVYDRLEEQFGRLPGTEKSLRNYIQYLIETGQLNLNQSVRMYTKVEDLPYGRQMQIDFGEYILPSGLKLYIFAGLLSASRYRYAAFQDRPFRTLDVIKHLIDAFDFFGGMPEELVIDQDSVLVVSENKGDIIYTKDFSAFIQEMNLKMYVCRKADPESKGKIENLVKYIKGNFLSTRDFTGCTEADDALKSWLSRRANGKISQAHNRIPSEMFEEEREFLRPVRNSVYRSGDIRFKESRKVSDQSFISAGGCDYSVPYSYRRRNVEIYETEETLTVYDLYSGEIIAEHAKSPVKGRKIIEKAHFRRGETKLDDLYSEVLSLFSLPEWKEFLELNQTAMPRYRRDQLIHAKKALSGISQEDIFKQSLKFCISNKTLSIANLSDTYKAFTEVNHPAVPDKTDPGKIRLVNGSNRASVEVHIRNLSEYSSRLSAGGENEDN